MSALRATLRMAWRELLRSKGRSALAFCMIALPVMVIVATAVLWRTNEWSPREALPYDLGRADARLFGETHRPLVQDAGRLNTGPDPAAAAPDADGGGPWSGDEARRAILARYGPATRLAEVVSDASAEVRTARGRVRADVRELDLRDPLTRGMLRITAGRAPATAGEVAISGALRDHGLALGSDIEIGGQGARKHVVGLVQDPRAPGRSLVQVLPHALAADGQSSWLIGTGGRAVTWSDVRDFNHGGATVLARAVVLHPPSKVPAVPGGGVQPAEAAVAAMIVAMVVLEVVLLAGPAFAVGIRRQRRRLALVAANGGDGRRLGMVVLAEGGVIGVAAAAFGAILGIVLAAVVAAAVEAASDHVFGPFDVPGLPVLLVIAVGALSGLLAALVPARQAARTNVVAALGGRRDDMRPARGRPVVGLLLAAAGVVVCVAGAKPLHEFGAAVGAIALIVGGVLLTPWVVALAGWAAGPLPLPLRLAVRDASRNSGRTVPAVAAILAAVAAITALSVGSSSDFEQGRREYAPRLPKGTAMVDVTEITDAARRDEIRSAIAAELPGVPVVPVPAVEEMGRDCGSSPDGCIMVRLGGQRTQDLYTDSVKLVVGGPEQARVAIGADVPEVTAALSAGKIVVLRAAALPGGTLTATVIREDDQGERPVREATVPAIARPADVRTQAIIPPAVARRLRLPTSLVYAVDRGAHRVTPAEEKRIQERISGVAPDVGLYVERGFTRSWGVVLLLLGGAGALLVLGGSLIATGLSAADSRSDLATLAAVGAAPRTRRLLMMGQAGCIAVIGCWLGIAAGLGPGVAAAIPLTSEFQGGAEIPGVPRHGAIISIPWELLGAIGVVVPLVAILAAALFTRSRLPVVRRIAD